MATAGRRPHVHRELSEVAEVIRRSRRARGWSQTELGDRAGLSRPTVARLERGFEGLSLGNLITVTEVLGLRLTVTVDGRQEYRDNVVVIAEPIE